MDKASFLPTVICGATLLVLAACSGGSSATEISTRNSGFFLGRVSDGTMRGAYNPAGFNATQVRKLITETCQQGQLTGFSIQDRTDGLTGFAATCTSWRDNARAVEYERSGGSGVVIEITGSASGTITYNRINTTV